MESLISDFNKIILNSKLDFIENVYLFNSYQSDIILKMHCNYSSDIYLSNYINTDESLNIEILGSKTSKGRETYNITLIENKFKCNCKDFQFRSKKNNIVCKHICFVVCKVANIYDLIYFQTKIFSEQNKKKLINVLNKPKLCINSEFKVNEIIDLNDMCPICCEPFNESKQILLSCPYCKKSVHKKCMEIWLEKNESCIYCRNLWDNYTLI